MADNTDLNLAIAVSLAESSDGFSDDDFNPSVPKVGLTQQLAFKACPIPTQHQQPIKRSDKNEDEKGNRLEEDSSGDEVQQKVNNSVKLARSLAMAELDRFRYTGGGLRGTHALSEAVPIMENESECVEVSVVNLDSPTEMHGPDHLVAEDFAPTADHAEGCLVIDIDTDEVVELCDETQFSILLRLCGEECEQDQFRTDVPDVDRVPTASDGTLVTSVSSFEQPSNLIPSMGGRPGCEAVEGEDGIVSTNLMGTVSDGSLSKEVGSRSAAALEKIDFYDADQSAVQERNDIEDQNLQDQFCEDVMSSMMTQKCVSQPEEVKAPHRIPPSPLQNISNLPARVDTIKQRVNVKSINQAAKGLESKRMRNEDALELRSRGSIRQVHKVGKSSEDHCQNKENVGDSPCNIVVVEHPFGSADAMARVSLREGHEPIVEDILLDSGEVKETMRCPICGENIGDIPVEERLAHTNSCLDKLGAMQECPREKGCSSVPASNQVEDWLEKLNLSRYVRLFVDQEIDWDTLPWLTEEDLIVMGIIAIGPRRKIFQAIQELKRGSTGCRTEPQNLPGAPSPVVENIRTNSGKEQLHEKSAGSTTAPLTGIVRSKTSKRPRSSVYQNNYGIPAWMCIPGTPFRVDAFQHLSGACSHWFLTHFHTDHYQGLTRGFRHGHIFCSSITARLVNLRIGVSWEKLMIIPLHEKVKIAGVDVTFIDANHCPGSVMILFEPPNGEAVLHTGDFRFCPEMANNPLLQTVDIHTLVLDTTYCDPQYDFPTQDTVIQFVIEAILAEMFNSDTLFLIGTYTIGKERIFLEVGKVLKKFVYIGAPKKKLLDCLNLSTDDTKWLTCNEQQSFIHVVPLWSISSFKRMDSIARHYQGRYKLIVAFSPTGWSFGRGKKKTPGKRWKRGTMIRYEVPYSEHCSFPELREFLRFIGPDDIIPSVPGQNGLGAEEMIASLWSEDQ